ncbi:unnamed protein product [Orchesella dallaii]|uniref:Uncharacterized protein n=1 Tax=Orchesella dallaii TaxID=48710 RepID=A0ABP1S7P2_9HEXA
MLSDRLFKILGVQLTLAKITSASPFVWNPDTRSLSVPKQFSVYNAAYIIGLILNDIFLAQQVLRLKLAGKSNNMEFYFLFAAMIALAAATVDALVAFRKPREVAYLFNNFRKFLKAMDGTVNIVLKKCPLNFRLNYTIRGLRERGMRYVIRTLRSWRVDCELEMNFNFERPLTRYQALLEGPLTTWWLADAMPSNAA